MSLEIELNKIKIKLYDKFGFEYESTIYQSFLTKFE